MDHSRVTISQSPMSCGVFELSNMTNDIKGMVYQIASRLYHPSRGNPVAFIVWSDVENSELSQELSAYCHGYNLGKIQISPNAENPRTGNIIRVHIWIINDEAFKKWYSDERTAKMGKVGT